jgi:hypothetical protein
MNDKKRPKNLRANEVPHEGFVLSVDGVMKAQFETLAEAMAAGSNLKTKFPVIYVQVFDATAQKYLPLA